MKNYFVLAVLFLYVIPSIGITFSAHYCGGELSAISIAAPTKKPCPCGSGFTKKSCCEDRIFSLKLNDQQQEATPVTVKLHTVHLPHSETGSFVLSFVHPAARRAAVRLSADPPGILKHPLYLLNEVFRI